MDNQEDNVRPNPKIKSNTHKSIKEYNQRTLNLTHQRTYIYKQMMRLINVLFNNLVHRNNEIETKLGVVPN